MNQHSAPILGVIARGGAGPTAGNSMVAVADPASPTWANELFRSRGPVGDAIVFVPDLERNPRIGRGTQLDELLPEHSPRLAVVTLGTHVTGIMAAIQDCSPRLGHRAEFIAAVRAHVAASYAGAWLKRVGKLESPSPSFGQHLMSWLPFSPGYFVTLHPTLAVRRRPQTSAGDVGSARLLRTSSAPSRRVGDALRKAYGVQHEEVLGAAHRLSARWGVDRVIEYVVGPEPAALQLPMPDGRCPTCGDPIWGQCAFCHLIPSRLDHWASVAVPGLAPFGPTPPPIDEEAAQPVTESVVEPLPEPLPAPAPEPVPPPAPKRAFQLPRHRPKAAAAESAANTSNPWLVD